MMNNHKFFNICNLYIIIWVLYIFHWQDVGEAVPLIDRFSNVFLSINLLISAYYTIFFWLRYKQTHIFVCMNIFMLSLVVYGFLSIIETDKIKVATGGYINSGTYLIAALRTFLPVYTCFVFTKLGYITEKTIKWWFWIFFAVSIIVYFLFRSNVLGFSTLNEMYTNNTAYLFVALVPFVFFYRDRPIIQYTAICLLFFLTVLGLKRGAILIMALSTLVFFFNHFHKGSKLARFLALFIFILMVVVGMDVITNIYEQSDVFQSRFISTLEGDSSGRDVIANILWDKYINSDIINIILGFGADATLKEYKYAHNDWLELLFNQGIVGVSLFLMLWLSMFKLWQKQKRYHGEYVFLIGLWLVSNFPRSLFSMWYSMANIITTLPLGFFLAKTYIRELKSDRFVKQ